jgi:hypothetical protein
MTAWEERITHTTAPAIVNEHKLRYAFAAGAIRASDVWADLGCGAGVAAAETLGVPFDGHLLLVDSDDDALAEAHVLLRATELTAIQADLTAPPDLDRVRNSLLDLAPRRGGCVTCFEVIEHLPNFVPLLDVLLDLSGVGYTVVLSVPNDAFWSLENPHHAARWSGAAFEEFRRNLPPDHVLAYQFPLTGSCVQPASRNGVPQTQESRFSVSSEGVPSHYIAAFGPGASGLPGVSDVVQLDLDRQRAWERQREADLEYYRAQALEQDRARG